MFNWAVIKPISLTIFKEFISTLIILIIIASSVFLLVFYSPNEDMLVEYILMISESLSGTEDVDFENLGFSSAFFIWASAVLSGNFGLSLSNGMPALEQSVEFLFNSSYLIFFSIILSLSIALPFSALIVRNKQPLIQKSLSFGLTSISFFPIFWFAYVVIFLAGYWFDYFPLVEESDESNNTAYFLPVVLLAIGSGLVIEITHLVSQEASRVAKEDYILCARAKGASVLHHIFKEGIAFPLLTLLSNRIAYMFGATIIVEQIFNWPGVGRLLWQATQNRDLPLLLAAVILTVIAIRMAQFAARVCYILMNPRASHE